MVALIWFVVSVPVLSLQMTLVHPSVSTLWRCLTIAFFFAIFRVPRAKQHILERQCDANAVVFLFVAAHKFQELLQIYILCDLASLARLTLGDAG